MPCLYALIINCMYPEYKHLNLPDIDKTILKFWKAEEIFEKSVAQRQLVFFLLWQ